MSSTRVRRVCSLLVALAFLSLTPAAVETARADNLGGVFEKCAQLTEFVPASDTDDGHLTLVGIGPGLYNAVDDTTHHQFPFSPDLVLSEVLQGQLQALADGLSFTCLRMKGDGGAPTLVTDIAIHRQTQACGVVSRDRAGAYFLEDKDQYQHTELLADAGNIVGSDFYLGHLLDAATGSRACLEFQLDAAGVVEAIFMDVSFTPCGTLFDGTPNLVVGKLLLGDGNSGTADLLPAKAAAAGFLLAREAAHGCASVEIQGSQILNAALTAEASICGLVQGSEGGPTLEGRTIDAVLNDAQARELEAAIGGSACASIAIESNQVSVALTTTPFTPAPTATPSPTPTPTPSPTPFATTSSSASSSDASPGVVPVGSVTPTGTDPSPVLPAILLVIGLAALGTIGFAYARRDRRQLADPPGSAPISGAPPEMDSNLPPNGTQPSVVTLTRREQEVLGMLYEGLSNKEIGARLFITESTAGVHISNIMTKLGARSRAEAAALAHRMGLTTGDAPQH